MNISQNDLFIDADPGMGIPCADIDDNLAILLAIFSKQLNLKFVSIVSGNVNAKKGASSLEMTLKHIDNPPEYAIGSTTPLMRNFKSGRQFEKEKLKSQGIELSFSGLIEGATPQASRNGICRLISLIEEPPGNITLVALGPLTNFALLFSQREDLLEKVDKLVIMGGAYAVPGNVTPYAEFNIWQDPEAAKIVFDLDIKKVVVGLDVTEKVSLTPELVRRKIKNDTKLGNLIVHSVEGWVEFLNKTYGAQGFHPHDPIAVSYLLEPDIFETETIDLDIDLTRAKTICNDQNNGQTTLCKRIDANKFQELFFEIINRGLIK